MTEKIPLTAEQLEYLQQEIVREARRTLVGRRLIGLYGPLGAGLGSVAIEHYGADEDAEIDLEGRVEPKPVVGQHEGGLRVRVYRGACL